MHIITRRRLLEAAEKHGDLGEPLDVWYRVAKRAEWKNLMDVRQAFPTADSEVLSGKRELNKGHIKRLSERFHASPEVFF